MRRVIAALALTVSLAACAPAEEAAQTEPDRDAIEQIVRSYILENPEIIEEALIELQRRARAREAELMNSAIAMNTSTIFQDSRDPVIGPADAPVTVVEFFDYRCSFCMVTNEWVQDIVAEHGDQVRVVFKEFPIRGAESLEGARAALAVWNIQPDAYLDFHSGLLNASGPLPSRRIDEIAEANGIDVMAMRAAMEDEAIGDHINDVRTLARQVGINGTPFFIVGDEIIPGADLDGLQRALDQALAAAG